MDEYELHIVSSGRLTMPRLAEIARDVHPYVTAIHVRERTRTAKEILHVIRQMLEEGVPLHKIRVNDRVDVAIAAGVGGVHLAGHSISAQQARGMCSERLVVGTSVHSPEEAIQAQREGADYAIYGHVYTTASKPGLEPRGLEQLVEVTRSVSMPVIAIGGITPERVSEVIGAGARGIAVMGGVCDADDPLKAVIAYAEALSRLKRAGMDGRGEFGVASRGN